MDIILVHLGSALPEYMGVCQRQAEIFSKDKVHCLHGYNEHAFTFVGEEKDLILEFLRSEFLKEFGLDKFWVYAALRLYAVLAYMKEKNISKALHIENDNLIYADPDDAGLDDLCGERVGLMELTDSQLSAGIMYVGSTNYLELVLQKLNDLLALGKTELQKRYGPEMLHEMRLLKIVQQENPALIALLPTLPSQKSNYVFDPASYGQYVGGTFQNPDKNFIDQNHIVGKRLLDDSLNVEWECGDKGVFPFVATAGRTVLKLFNLHIHSKNLKRWATV